MTPVLDNTNPYPLSKVKGSQFKLEVTVKRVTKKRLAGFIFAS